MKLADMDSLGMYSGGADDMKPSDYVKSNIFLGASFQARFEAEDAIEMATGEHHLGHRLPARRRHLALPGRALEPHRASCRCGTPTGPRPRQGAGACSGSTACGSTGFDGEAMHDIAQQINAPTRAQINEPLDEIPADGGLWAFRTVGVFM